MLRGGLRPWSQKGPEHGVGVDPETVRIWPQDSGLNNSYPRYSGMSSYLSPRAKCSGKAATHRGLQECRRRRALEDM